MECYHGGVGISECEEWITYGWKYSTCGREGDFINKGDENLEDNVGDDKEGDVTIFEKMMSLDEPITLDVDGIEEEEEAVQ